MRDEAEVRRRIRDAVREMAPNPDGWTVDDPRLAEDLEYYSLALVELSFVLEEMFELPPIEESSAAAIRTVVDVEDYIVTTLSELAV